MMRPGPDSTAQERLDAAVVDAYERRIAAQPATAEDAQLEAEIAAAELRAYAQLHQRVAALPRPAVAAHVRSTVLSAAADQAAQFAEAAAEGPRLLRWLRWLLRPAPMMGLVTAAAVLLAVAVRQEPAAVSARPDGAVAMAEAPAAPEVAAAPRGLDAAAAPAAAPLVAGGGQPGWAAASPASAATEPPAPQPDAPAAERLQRPVHTIEASAASLGPVTDPALAMPAPAVAPGQPNTNGQANAAGQANGLGKPAAATQLGDASLDSAEKVGRPASAERMASPANAPQQAAGTAPARTYEEDAQQRAPTAGAYGDAYNQIANNEKATAQAAQSARAQPGAAKLPMAGRDANTKNLAAAASVHDELGSDANRRAPADTAAPASPQDDDARPNRETNQVAKRAESDAMNRARQAVAQAQTPEDKLAALQQQLAAAQAAGDTPLVKATLAELKAVQSRLAAKKRSAEVQQTPPAERAKQAPKTGPAELKAQQRTNDKPER